MARSDLLLSLVRAGTSGDTRGFRRTAEALIAEERAKQHFVLAESLSRVIGGESGRAPSTLGSSGQPSTEATSRGREFIAEQIPRRRLDELVLPTGARRIVGDLIEEQQRADVLRAHGLEPRNRILLVGPPGTGKSVLTETIAESIGVRLFVVRYESMIGSFLGETASRLKRVFDYARTSPCVLFFDEFDAIAKERGDIHETGEIKRVVSSLLMQIDELPTYTLVVAATNHPELLDRATWRRFQVRLILPMPTPRTLAMFLQERFAALGEPIGHSIAAVAKRLGPISFAEAEEFCLDVKRRYVLSMGQQSAKAVVSQQLDAWSIRTSAIGATNQRGHGKSTATRAPKR